MVLYHLIYIVNEMKRVNKISVENSAAERIVMHLNDD